MKKSDLIIPALQEIVQYDWSLLKDTNDNLQTPFFISNFLQCDNLYAMLVLQELSK